MAVVTSRDAAHLWEDPQHRAATMETPRLGKTHGNTHLHMETPRSWQRTQRRQRQHNAVLTTGVPPTPVPGQGGVHRELWWAQSHPGGRTHPTACTQRAGVSTQQELLLGPA